MIIRGDARQLPLPDASVDAIVTDPPYHLTALSRNGSPRVPGAGPFGRHRVGERGFMGKTWDAGGVAFDPATWAEAFRVLRPGGRLLAFGGTRTHHRIWCAIEDAGFVLEDTIMWLYGSGFPKHRSKLKPAYEPIVVARKGPVTALNIDACRIGTGDGGDRTGEASAHRRYSERGATSFAPLPGPRGGDAAGRWPANVVLDEEAAVILDAQSGDRGGRGLRRPNTGQVVGYGDSSGASRFFYCAKADRAEREMGLEGMPLRSCGTMEDDGYDWERERERGLQPLDTRRRNHHPTVKPVALMRWLVRLVTRPGDLVLDQFAGSGTTGVACTLEGRRFILVENNAEYCEIAERRVAAAPLPLPLFTAAGVGD